MGVEKQLMEMKQAVKDANRRLMTAEDAAKRDKERQEKALDAARARTKEIQDKAEAEKAAMEAAKKAEEAARAAQEDGSDLREKYGLTDEDPPLSSSAVEALSACDYMSDRVTLMLRMGNYEKATGLLEECYTTRHKYLEGKPITLNTLYLLGESMRQQGNLHRAGKLLSNCLKLYTEKHGRISELSAACITGLAEIARAKGNLERSQKLHDECLQIRIQVKGHAEITLECLRRLSIQRWMIPEATDYAKKSNDLLKRIFAGKRCAELAGGIFGRAEIMLLKGDIEGCRNPLEQVLANRRVTLADRHPLVAESLLTMGHLLLVNGSLEEAERRYEQSWEMRKDFYADDGAMLMEMDCLRGKMMRMLGRYPQAVPLLEVTVEQQKKLIALHSTGEFQLADTQFELGEAFRDLGKYDDARRNYSVALQARRKELGTEPNPVLAINILSLADTARRVGRIADASKLIAKGVETMKGAVAETHYSWVHALMYKADMQLSSKEYSEALMTIQTAQGIMKEHIPQDDLHHWAGWLQNTQGECLRAMDDGDEALKVLQSALMVRKMSFADTHLLVIETKNNIAVTLAWRNRAYSRRLKTTTAVMELMEKKSEDGGPRLFPSFPDEDFQTALTMLRKCIRQMEEQGLGTHPMTTNMRGNIGLIRKTLNDEKFKFVSKLTKAHRGLFKAAEDQKEADEVRAAEEAAEELGLLRAKVRELQKNKDDAEVAASHALAAGEVAPLSSPDKKAGSPKKKNDNKAASPDKDVTAAEVEAAAQAARALDPAVIDALQDIIDRHYLDPALVTLEKAVDVLEQERYTPQHPWMAKFSSALVSDGRPDELQVVVEISKDGLALLRQGQYSDAEAKFEVAMEVVVEFMGESSDPQPAQAEVLFYMAENYSQQGRLADALAKYSAAYAIWLQVFGEESEEVTSVIYGKAELCLINGLFEEARSEHERAFEIRKRLLGVDNIATIRSAVAISNVCRMAGDFAAAHAKARDACDKLNKIEGKQRLENAEFIAAGNACLARCLLAQGAPKEAREVMTAAMELAKLEFGESHPLVADLLCGLADVSTAQGMIHDAKHLISKAFKLRIKFFGVKCIDPNEGKDEKGNDLPDWEKPEPALIYEREEVPPHALIADTLCAKAINLISLDEFGEATESLLRSAQLMRERLSGPQTPYVCRIAYLQGHMLYMRGKYFPALDKLGLTRRMQLQILGEKHPDFGDTLFLMATIQSRMSKLLDAEQLLDECKKNRMELHRDKFHKKRADDDAKANKGKKDKALTRKEAEAAEASKSMLAEKTVLLHNHTPYHPKLLECNVLAAYLHKYRGSFMDCKALCEDTVNAYKETLGPAHPTTAHAALLLGETLRDLGALEMSYAMIEKALAARSSSLHENHHLVAECLNALAETMRVQGKYLESKKINEQALGIRRAMLGKYHYDTARSLCSLGQNFHDLGMYPSADTLFNKALQLSRRCAKSEDHRLVADCIHARGENLIALGRYPEATVELARGKAIRVKLFGEMHPDVAVSIFAESDLNFLLGNNEAAIHGYDDTLSIRKTLFGSMSREVASSLNGIGRTLVAQAKFGEARNMLDRSLLMRKRLLGSDHPDMGDSLFALAVIDYDMGRIEQATVTMERCLDTWKVALGARHPKNATALCALADMYRSMGSLNAAIDATTDSLKIRKASLGDEHPRTVESLLSYSLNLMMMGIYDDPQAIGKSADNAKLENEEDGDRDFGRAPEPEKKKKQPKVVEGKEEEEDEEGDDVADDDSIKSITSRDLEGLGGDKQKGGGGGHGRRGDADPTMKFAATLLVRVLQSRSSYFGPDHWSVLEAQHFLALCHLESGKLQEALELITDTVFLRQKVLGEDHPLTAQSIVALAEILRAQSRIYPNGKVGDKDGNATAGEDDEGTGGSPAKSGRVRKAGPTLVDQLASVIDKEHWKESASGALTAAADFSAMDKKPMKLALPQGGFMGYQFPAEKRLGRLGGNASRFANLKEDDARWLLDTAHKIYVASYGAVASNLRFTMHIAHCKGELERSRRNTGASRGLHETTLEHRRHLLPSGHPDIAKSLFAIAETYRVENKFKASEPLHEMARDMRIQVYGTNHPLVADSLNALALLDFAKGNYMEADTLYKQVREVRTNFFGKYHLAVAQTLNNIAGLAHINGDKDEAETMYRACLDIKKRVYGSDHPDYATALNNLGLLLKAKGVLTEAEKLYNKALDVQKNHFGNEHPDVASTLNNIAALLFAQGDVMKAQQLYRESITVKRVCLGIDHPSVAAALNNLAGLLFHSKSFEEAREHYEDSLRIRTKAFGGDHPLVAESLNNIALMFATEGKLEDARMLYSRALIIKTNVFGEEHEVVASAMASLAFVLQSLGKASEARRLLDDTLEIRERVLGEDHPDTLATADAVERLRVKDVVSRGEDPQSKPTDDLVEDSFFAGMDGVVQ
jgi:tetratricopeptide (TPR) repeat protein